MGTQEAPKGACVLARHRLEWEGCVSVDNTPPEGAVQLLHSTAREEEPPLPQGWSQQRDRLSCSGAGWYPAPSGLPDPCVMVVTPAHTCAQLWFSVLK